MRAFFLASVLVLVASAPAYAQFTCSTEVRFHFIGVHRDDGSKGPGFNPASLATFVQRANATFGGAGLNFVFRQNQDWEEINSTLLWHGLRSYNGSSADELSAHALAQSLVDARPGKIVVFFREDTGNDYAAPRLLGAKPPNTGWQDGLDYISFWNFSDHVANTAPSEWNKEAGVFVHELGHYLGLYHSQPSAGSLTAAEARARLETAHNPCVTDAQCTIPGTRCVVGACRDTMDGDPNVSDVTEDPSPNAWLNGCSATPACPSGQGKGGPLCLCMPFASLGSSTIGTALACSTAADCGTTGPGQSRTCSNGFCRFTYTPSLTNVMSYYGGPDPTVTPGQLARIQASITAIPQRNLLCNVPCWTNFHDLPVSSTEQCLNYWRRREDLGPHALTIDPTGTRSAGTLRSNTNLFFKSTARADLEATSTLFSAFGFASHHYSWRPNAPVGFMLTRNLNGASVSAFHQLDWNAFVTQWNTQFTAGRALVDVSVTRANPLELSAVWANQGGSTSATYWVGTEAEVKSLSNGFYGNRIRLDRVVPVSNGTSHSLIANWNASTALRGLWSVPNASYQSLFTTLGGLGYVLHDLEYFENGGLTSVWEAPHNECTAGSRLHRDTDVCTKLICDTHSPWADSYCCNNAWDSICVGEVTSWCGRSCPP